MNRVAAETEQGDAITFERRAYIPPDMKQVYACMTLAISSALTLKFGNSLFEMTIYFVVIFTTVASSILFGWVVLPALSDPHAIEIGDDYVSIHYRGDKVKYDRAAVTLKERSNGSSPWWWTGTHGPDVRVLVNRRHAFTLLHGCWDLDTIKHQLPVVETS